MKGNDRVKATEKAFREQQQLEQTLLPKKYFA
jgi:hypothetical protein